MSDVIRYIHQEEQREGSGLIQFIKVVVMIDFIRPCTRKKVGRVEEDESIR